MKAIDMKTLIAGLTQDIDFEYHGKHGAICPFSHSDISLSYDGKEITVESVELAMSTPFVDGKSLAEVCEELVV